jgi:flagellar secretion chaperone FliS
MNIATRYDLDEMMIASPSRLVVMLYDEAIEALNLAAAATRTGDIETRCNAVTAAIEIVGLLYMTLDMDRGGDVAHNLGALYAHIINRLPQVNLNRDPRIAEEAVGLLTPLRASWNELDISIACGIADEMLPAMALTTTDEKNGTSAGAF